MLSPGLEGSPATALAVRVMPLQRRVVRCYVTGVTLFPGCGFAVTVLCSRRPIRPLARLLGAALPVRRGIASKRCACWCVRESARLLHLAVVRDERLGMSACVFATGCDT